MTDEFILQIMDKFNSSEIVDLDLARGDNHISLSKKEACTTQWGQSKTDNEELKIKNEELDFNNIEQSNSNDEFESRQKGQSKLDTSHGGQSKPDNSQWGQSKPAETLNSPIVGTFYRAPSPDAPAYAEKGTVIRKGEPVCIIEAMKMMNTLNADYDFEVLEVLVENGELVEYDQPLFAIKKL